MSDRRDTVLREIQNNSLVDLPFFLQRFTNKKISSSLNCQTESF